MSLKQVDYRGTVQVQLQHGTIASIKLSVMETEVRL